MKHTLEPLDIVVRPGVIDIEDILVLAHYENVAVLEISTRQKYPALWAYTGFGIDIGAGPDTMNVDRTKRDKLTSVRIENLGGPSETWATSGCQCLRYGIIVTFVRYPEDIEGATWRTEEPE